MQLSGSLKGFFWVPVGIFLVTACTPQAPMSSSTKTKTSALVHNWEYLAVRYNPDGTLDHSLNGSGFVIGEDEIDNQALTAVVDGTGKIVIGGVYDIGSWKTLLIRYFEDGRLDTSFGNNGKVFKGLSFATSIDLTALAIDARGRIVALGGFTGDGLHWHPFLLRFNSNGTLDPSFSGDGIFTLDIPTPRTPPKLILDQNGKILAAGCEDGKVLLFRLNSNGQPDSSFGSHGIVRTDFSSTTNECAEGLAIDEQGKIVIAGTGETSTQRVIILARYNDDGSPDVTFNSTSGLILSPPVFGGSATNTADTSGRKMWRLFSKHSTIIRDMKLDSQGRIVVGGGSHLTASWHHFFARFNRDGSLDTSFNGTGYRSFKLGITGRQEWVKSIAIVPGDKIAFSGYKNIQNTFPSSQTSLGRLLENGNLDHAFAGTGYVSVTAGNPMSAAINMISDPQERLLVLGASNVDQECETGDLQYCGWCDGTRKAQKCEHNQITWVWGPCECLTCTPNNSRSCSCGSGLTGTQRCNSSGSGWGACQNCHLCSPGASRSCACGGGREGRQYCSSDGLSWGSCQECQTCAPGATRNCSCLNGRTGTQQCNSTGSGWTSCRCSDSESCNEQGESCCFDSYHSVEGYCRGINIECATGGYCNICAKVGDACCYRDSWTGLGYCGNGLDCNFGICSK